MLPWETPPKFRMKGPCSPANRAFSARFTWHNTSSSGEQPHVLGVCKAQVRPRSVLPCRFPRMWAITAASSQSQELPSPTSQGHKALTEHPNHSCPKQHPGSLMLKMIKGKFLCIYHQHLAGTCSTHMEYNQFSDITSFSHKSWL